MDNQVVSDQATHFYYVAGFLIVSNIGAIFTVFIMGFRVVWWASKIDAKLEAAHKRIDEIVGKR